MLRKLRKNLSVKPEPVHFRLWAAICLVSLIKLIFVSDYTVWIQHYEHDSQLYVSRAFQLLTGNAFGPYDAYTLLKLPGLSFWIAATRSLGLPYLLSLNLFYLGVGAYMVFVLKRCGLSVAACLITFLFYAFSPVTLDGYWIIAGREPVSLCFLGLLFASAADLFCALRDNRSPFVSSVILAFSVAFSLALREEDKILLAAAGWVACIAIYELFRKRHLMIGSIYKPILLIVFPLVAIPVLTNFFSRQYVARHYGHPILNDFNEGEFPKFIAAVRSTNTHASNRLIYFTSENLKQVSERVPRLKPLVQKMLVPSDASASCLYFGICDELAGFQLMVSVKEAAYLAGLTPTLTKAQEFFRLARYELEQACVSQELNCKKRGSGLLPPFQLNFTRAYLYEIYDITGKWLHSPLYPPGPPPASYPASINVARQFQLATMTSYVDTLSIQEREEHERWKIYGDETYLSLKYWLYHPEVASSSQYGPGRGLARAKRNSEYEEQQKRLMREQFALSPPVYRSALAGLRNWIARWYNQLDWVVELLGLVALLGGLLLKLPRRRPLMLAIGIFFGITLLRLLALAYVALFLGSHQPRLVYPSHSMLLVICIILITESVETLLKKGDLRQ